VLFVQVREKNIFVAFKELWLLVLVLVVHTATSVIILRDYYSSLHPLLVALSASSPAELCHDINYSTEQCSPLLSILWIASRIIPSELVAYLLTAVGVVLVYLLARVLVGGEYAPVIASLLYAFTPCILQPSLLDYYGFSLLTPLVLASLFLTIKGLVDVNSKLVTAGCIIQGLVAAAYIAHWAVPLVLGVYLLVKFTREELSALEKAVAGYYIAITAIRLLFSASSYEYFFSLLAILLLLGLLVVDRVVKLRDATAKASLCALILVLAVGLSGIISTALGAGLRELGVKLSTPPVLAYGFGGLLALGGLVLTLRERVGIQRSALLVLLVVSALTSLIVPSLVPLVVASMATLSGLLLEAVIRATGYAASRRLIVLTRVLVVLLLVAVVVASTQVAVDNAYAAHPVISRIDPLANGGNRAEIYTWLSRVGEEIATRILENSTSRRVLIVSHWDYTYWLYAEASRRGLEAYFISHPLGSSSDKDLIARIFTSSEEVSKYILENVSRKLGVEDIYLVVICDYSVRRGLRAEDAYIGYPYGLIGDRRRELIYRTLGDLALIPVYLEIANRSVNEYLALQIPDTGIQALVWTDRGVDLLIVKLAISALHGLNYTNVFNYLYSYLPVTTKLTFYRLVYANRVYLRTIDMQDYGIYDVYLVIGVFKVVFESSK
jgi:hypothetical protein